MSMVRYQLLGNNGWTAFVTDYCFRGLASHTPVWWISDFSLASPEGEVFNTEDEYDEEENLVNTGTDSDFMNEMFEEIRNSIKSVAFEVLSYRTDVIKELKQLVESVSWMKDVVTCQEGSRISTFTVRGDVEGDHLFHALSTLRNIEMHMWNSYMAYREEFNPMQSLTLLMFSPKVTDFAGKVQYVGYNYGQDYMWSNTHTVTRGSVKSVVENGPRWFMGKGNLDYYHKPLPFTPTVMGVDRDDPTSHNWSSSTDSRLFRSFEIPVESDEDPVTFDVPEDIIKYVKELI